MKTLFAFCTFGNQPFSELAVKSIRETITKEYDIFAIVGKPGDWATKRWLDSERIPHIMHKENMGFPVALNDMFDYAWKDHNYDNLIIMGNDVILYDYAGNSLIQHAEETDYQIINASKYEVKDLVRDFPEVSSQFKRGSYNIYDFSNEPWKKFTDYSDSRRTEPLSTFDIQNLCLYKRSVFDTLGYADVNFYPAYFVDNDYGRRVMMSGIKSCMLTDARFFHWWSRTLHQESGGSNHAYFRNNEAYYIHKWGGKVGEETITPPMKISDRSHELETVRYWRSRG